MAACMQSSYVPCGCKALLSEKDPRAPIWMAVFGKLEFPLKNPVPTMGMGPGEIPDRFLKGDWGALSLDQQNILINEMVKKFKANVNNFADQLNTLGFIPIKDVNISVLVCGLHTRCMM